ITTHCHSAVPVLINNITDIAYYTNLATTKINSLSLHDALPIYNMMIAYNLTGQNPKPEDMIDQSLAPRAGEHLIKNGRARRQALDRKSTRLNSSHVKSSYAVFCVKKKKIHLIIYLQ